MSVEGYLATRDQRFTLGVGGGWVGGGWEGGEGDERGVRGIGGGWEGGEEDRRGYECEDI